MISRDRDDNDADGDHEDNDINVGGRGGEAIEGVFNSLAAVSCLTMDFFLLEPYSNKSNLHPKKTTYLLHTVNDKALNKSSG